jgi:hypothetical protein
MINNKEENMTYNKELSLKQTFMYFPWFFILPPLLKSSQNFTFDGQMVFLNIIFREKVTKSHFLKKTYSWKCESYLKW